MFALQSLVNEAHGAQEAAIFVAFEQSTSQIIANAKMFGWRLPALSRKKLFFLDARRGPDVVKAGDFDLIACCGRDYGAGRTSIAATAWSFRVGSS